MKGFKKVIFLSFVFLLSFVVVPNFVSASTSTDEPLLTVEEYKNFLSLESPETLVEFSLLSTAEQEEFIQKLQDPATYSSLAYTQETLSSVQSTDVPKASMLATTASTLKTYNVVGQNVVTIKNIKVLEYKANIRYTVQGLYVKSILNADAYVVTNLNPLVQTAKISNQSWIAGNNANLHAVFDYRLGPIYGLSTQVGVVNVELSGSMNGTRLKNRWY